MFSSRVNAGVSPLCSLLCTLRLTTCVMPCFRMRWIGVINNRSMTEAAADTIGKTEQQKCRVFQFLFEKKVLGLTRRQCLSNSPRLATLGQPRGCACRMCGAGQPSSRQRHTCRRSSCDLLRFRLFCFLVFSSCCDDVVIGDSDGDDWRWYFFVVP